jgi:hypothetical protein
MREIALTNSNQNRDGTAIRQDLVLVPRREQAKAEYECLFGKLWSGGGYGGESNPDGHAAGKNVSLINAAR